MGHDLKQRLVGAVVLITLAVVFIPLFLSEQPVTLMPPEPTNERINDEEFSSSLVPLTEVPESVEPDLTTNTELPEAVKPEPDISDIMPIEQSIPESIASPEIEKPASQNTKDDSANNAGKSDPESVTIETSKPKTTEIKTTVGATRAWVVQLASFNSEENAKKLNQQLLDKNFESFIEPLTNKTNQKVVYRVRVGPPLLDKAKVEQIRQQLNKTMNLDGILVEYP